MKIAVLFAQIGAYHDARLRAVARVSKLAAVSVTNDADFSEFLATRTGDYPVVRLFVGRAEYDAARRTGAVRAVVWRALAEASPDVVAVAGWATADSLAAIAWARSLGRGIVMMSDSQRADAIRSPWREAIKARIVRACQAALVAGRPHRDYVVDLGMASERVFLGYDAVDNEFFAAGADAAREEPTARRAELGLPVRYLLASARFIAKKNLPGLVAAYAAMLDDRTDAPDLVILGDGPERPAVEAAIARHGVGTRVHLPGFQGYEALPAFYGLAEGFVHVSFVDTWGLVVNEALAAGLPVVVSRPCGAAAELVQDGVNGFLVDPSDVAGMTEALGRLADLEPTRRAAMAEAGRRIVADWGPARFAEGLLAAAEAARAVPVRPLAPWDAALFRGLARMHITAVP